MLNKKIIAFEGLDGVGKTKFSKLLNNFLINKNKNVSLWAIDSHHTITTKEKRCPELSFQYYLSSLRKRLTYNTNEFIIFDRYIPSALGYKLIRSNEKIIDENILIELNTLYNELIKPDITFLLTTPYNIRKQNIFLKDKIDYYDRQSLKSKNTIFWDHFYSNIYDKSFLNIETNRNEQEILNNIIQIVER